MKLSPAVTRLLLNAFPPLLFGRIAIRHLAPDFRTLTVRVRPSLLNRNLQGTLFGRTIFSAADPYYAIMYWQLMAHRGLPAEAWLKSATVDYHQPGKSHLTLRFCLTDDDVTAAERGLKRTGKFERWHQVEARDAAGVPCATVRTLIHLRLRNASFPPAPPATPVA